MIPSYEVLRVKIQGQEDWWLQKVSGRMESCLVGTVLVLQDEKKFWRWMVVMVAQREHP